MSILKQWVYLNTVCSDDHILFGEGNKTVVKIRRLGEYKRPEGQKNEHVIGILFRWRDRRKTYMEYAFSNPTIYLRILWLTFSSRWTFTLSKKKKKNAHKFNQYLKYLKWLVYQEKICGDIISW